MERARLEEVFWQKRDFTWGLKNRKSDCVANFRRERSFRLEVFDTERSYRVETRVIKSQVKVWFTGRDSGHFVFEEDLEAMKLNAPGVPKSEGRVLGNRRSIEIWKVDMSLCNVCCAHEGDTVYGVSTLSFVVAATN